LLHFCGVGSFFLEFFEEQKSFFEFHDLPVNLVAVRRHDGLAAARNMLKSEIIKIRLNFGCLVALKSQL
jgi:hypothetical protein